MTAVLENINKFSHLGLKRRPTYDEVIGLIRENETITGNLPDRTATFYKASQEGSFFDGSDALEILKEQQNRIMEREMRDILMRRNARLSGRTFNVDRIQASSSETAPAEVQPDRETLSAGLQADLQRREAQLRDRQQQTGEAHRGLLSRATMPILEGLFSSRGQSSSVFNRTEADTPVSVFDSPASTPVKPTRADTPVGVDTSPEMFVIGSESEQEMQTPREQPKSKLLKTISYSNNIKNWSEDELAFQLFIRGRDVNSPEWSLEGLKKKGGGRNISKRQHYRNLAQQMIDDGSWETRIEEQLLMKRISDFNNKGKGSGSSSSK